MARKQPKTKATAKGRDFSACKFVSVFEGPRPPGIRHMLDRALESFGPDPFVIKNRWTQQLPVLGVQEWEHFTSGAGDICCAHIAAFVRLGPAHAPSPPSICSTMLCRRSTPSLIPVRPPAALVI